MLDLMGEKTGQVLIGADLDTVLVGIDLPASCTLKNVQITVDMVGTSVAKERENAIGYAAAAYIIAVEDPSIRVDYDVLWDRFVPKYTDLDVIDLDTTTAVTTPFWEPGEASFEDVFDMGNRPQKVFGRKKQMNFSDPGSSGLKFQPSETPFEPQWFGSDRFVMRMNRGVRVRNPSVLLLAVASPAFDDTVTARSVLTEAQWGQIQYAEATLERALMNQLVLQEAGAETPWEEASDTLRQYLAPNVFEVTAGAFVTEGWNSFTQAQWTLQVPGKMEFDRIDLTP